MFFVFAIYICVKLTLTVMEYFMNVQYSILFTLSLMVTTIYSNELFTGTWCIGGETLVIHFGKNNTLKFDNANDESGSGSGTYVATDSTLSANISNGELTIKMEYLYKVESESKVKAKITKLLVDGEETASNKGWKTMERCTPSENDEGNEMDEMED